MEIIVDETRLDEVIGTLLATYQADAYPYNLPGAVLPQDPAHLPHKLELGSVDHAMFLFSICYYMRGGMKSVTATRQLSRLYVRRPNVFDANHVSNVRKSLLRISLECVDLKYLKNNVPGYWIENARRIVELYGGDPRNIFAGVADFEEACHRVRNNKRGGGFMGFQEKMVSMLLYYFMDASLIEKFPFPIPIDFHVMRVSVATGIVTFKDMPENRDVYSKQLLAVLRDIYLDYVIRYNVDPVILANAIWLMSNTLCANNPGNRISQEGVYAARSTILNEPSPEWTTNEISWYERTCGSCVIETLCDLNIPNGHYTRKGQIYVMRRRINPTSPIVLPSPESQTSPERPLLAVV